MKDKLKTLCSSDSTFICQQELEIPSHSTGWTGWDTGVKCRRYVLKTIIPKGGVLKCVLYLYLLSCSWMGGNKKANKLLLEALRCVFSKCLFFYNFFFSPRICKFIYCSVLLQIYDKLSILDFFPHLITSAILIPSSWNVSPIRVNAIHNFMNFF